ncbi:MAG: L-threonylcarbamoyladenylate synthase [Gammaproteobacteria bacterium]|nr:L-threonylcarbamoyladenylate synthase [Gammaproteobacteria bacterium]
MSPWALNRLANAISAGAVIGYPTDTVWGLGCDPLNLASIARILQIKNRRPDKGLILLSSRLEYCSPYIDIDGAQRESLLSPCARPTTWLVSASKQCPWWICGIHSTAAIRICDHPLLQVICDQLKAPLVSTSANRADRATVRNALQLRRHFGGEVDCIVTGFSAGSGKPSKIKSLAGGTILRSSS